MSDRTAIHRGKWRPVMVTVATARDVSNAKIVMLNETPASAPAASTPQNTMLLMGV